MNEVPTGMLRQTLRGRTPAGPSPECLDAGTAAAWADDTLSRRERAAAEAHAADCARCQALIAALAKTAPPVAARSWWRMPAVTWLVPLTAAAAALLLYVNVSYRARPMANDRVAPAAIEAGATAQALPAPSPPILADRAPVPQPQANRSDYLSRAKAASGASAGAGRPATDEFLRRERPAERRDAEPRARSDSKAAAPVQSNAIAAAEALRALPAAPPAVAPSASPTAASPPPPSESVAAATPAADAAQTFAARAPAPMRMMLKAPEPPPIISTDSNTRWRIVTGGGVERSTDGGSTWQSQATGVAVTLTAGVSTSPTICWLVGPGGIVLLSTDGRSWQRVVSPAAADLSSVRATDDKIATVTTADGRAFSTTDGGRTWTRTTGR
jgi:hypothetical protein